MYIHVYCSWAVWVVRTRSCRTCVSATGPESTLAFSQTLLAHTPWTSLTVPSLATSAFPSSRTSTKARPTLSPSPSTDLRWLIRSGDRYWSTKSSSSRWRTSSLSSPRRISVSSSMYCPGSTSVLIQDTGTRYRRHSAFVLFVCLFVLCVRAS